LGNHELFEMTLRPGESEISEDQLRARLAFLSEADGTCDYGIPDVASRFCELPVSHFDTLSLSVLGAILSDSGLVVHDEDSVFAVVHRRAPEDLSYFGLLEYGRFEFVSDECMKRVIEFISASWESLMFEIWSSF
jgi:hypothetical protein